MRWRLLALARLLALSAAAEERVWPWLTWGSVEILTAADAGLARAAVAEHAALEEILSHSAPGLAGETRRLRVVLLDSNSGAEEFRRNVFSAGIYLPGPAWSAIALLDFGEGSLPVLRHEYVHHRLRASGRRLPLWLEEGLADALSCLPQTEAGQRVRRFRAGHRIRWRELFEARPGAALYHDRDSALVFCAQSWALTEALLRSSGHRVRGEDLERWQGADRLPEEELEAWLERFLKRSWPGRRNGRLKRRPVETVSGPAPAGLVWTALGRISLQLGDLKAAETRLRRASLLWPESLPWLGEVLYHQGRLPEARRIWRRAMATGLADAQTLFRLAVLEQDLPGGNMAPVLERLLEADPAQEEARLALVAHYLRSGRWSDARRRLQEVREVPPRWEAFCRQAVARLDGSLSVTP